MIQGFIHIGRIPILSLAMVLAGFLFKTPMTPNRSGQASAPMRVVWDETNLDLPVKALYEKDAARLALRSLAQGNNNYEKFTPTIPKETQTELYKALLAIHESPLPEAQQVTGVHRLHTFPNPVVDMFQVNYDKTATWATPLRLGDLSTDNATINQLCEEYGLVVDSHQNWDEETNMFVVKATTPINMAPLAVSFQEVDGITLARLPIPDSDGNDIEAYKTAKGWRLDYKVKFGDCFTGCKNEHVWSFEVSSLQSNSAIVVFKGESGDELPDWMK